MPGRCGTSISQGQRRSFITRSSHRPSHISWLAVGLEPGVERKSGLQARQHGRFLLIFVEG